MNCKDQSYSDWIKKKPEAMAVCLLSLKATNQRFLLVLSSLLSLLSSLSSPLSLQCLSCRCLSSQGNTRLCSERGNSDVRAVHTQAIVTSLGAILKQEV
jgi:hypothetical protein